MGYRVGKIQKVINERTVLVTVASLQHGKSCIIKPAVPMECPVQRTVLLCPASAADSLPVDQSVMKAKD